jgi:hypothetical protein
MMLFDSLHGRGGQIRRQLNKQATVLLAAGRLEKLAVGTLLDTVEHPSIVLVDKEHEPSKDCRFHCYLIATTIVNVSPPEQLRDQMHQWLASSLDDESRFVCTMSGFAWLGLDQRGPDFARVYVEAAIRHWPSLAKERERFLRFRGDDDILKRWRTLFFATEMLGLTAVRRMERPGLEPQELLRLAESTRAPS